MLWSKSNNTLAPNMPFLPPVTTGLLAAYWFGGDLDRSMRNHWHGGPYSGPAGDLDVPAGLQPPLVITEGGGSFCRFTDTARFFQSPILDNGTLGFAVICRFRNLGSVSIVAASKTTAMGDYGVNMWFHSSGQLRFQRESVNSGTQYMITPSLTPASPTSWGLYWAGNDASAALLENATPANPVVAPQSIVGTLVASPRALRIGADYSASTIGEIDIKGVIIFGAGLPTAKDRRAIDTELRANCAAENITLAAA